MIANMDNSVAAIFNSWSDVTRQGALALREMIIQTANELPQVGPVFETLKWNQPAYLTPQSKSGTTIRLGEIENENRLGLYVNCQTSLVETYRSHYSNILTFSGNRAILLDPSKKLPEKALKHCISLALTYHLRK